MPEQIDKRDSLGRFAKGRRGFTTCSPSRFVCGHIGYNKLPKGEAAFNRLWTDMKIRSKRQDHVWRISKDKLRKIVILPCHYCGSPPMNENYITSKKMNGSFIYSGLDRVDNNCGYTIDNVVPCCKVCNHAKSNLTLENFYIWIKNVYERSIQNDRTK